MVGAKKSPKRRYATRMPVAARREQLLDAALAVLDRDGYRGLTVEAIAAEAGVTRPVFYAAYENIDALHNALLDRTRNAALDQAMHVLTVSGDPRDVDAWILNACGALIDQVVEHPRVWKPVLGVTHDAPRVVRERIAATIELIHGYLTTGLATGIELRGGPDVDPDVLARLTLSTAQEFGRLVLEQPERYPKERLITALQVMLASALPHRTE
ncbi:MAG: TetR/AcrR family transcriptional regulator [Nocardioides sp.]